jgi:predicted phage terminase large subunit-like protein
VAAAAVKLGALLELERRECEGSFYRFVVAAWDVLNPSVPFVRAPYLELLCEHLEAAVLGDCRRLLVAVPPRSGKSTLTSVCLPVWGWVKDPTSRWLFASHALDLALMHSRARAALIESEWFRRHWGQRFALTACSATEIRNDQHGHMTATTVQGATGKGGNFLVLDDPHSAADAWSDALREKDNDQIRGSLMSRLDNPRQSTMIVIQQRLHEHDATGMLLELGGWRQLELPVVAQKDEEIQYPRTGRVWRRAPGDLLDPERFSAEVIGRLQAQMGSLHFAGQYLQQPYSPGGTIFRRDWWKRYGAAEQPAEFDQIVVSVDCAFKAARENDLVAIQTWGLVGPRSYLLGKSAQHRGYAETKTAVREAIAATPGVSAVLVEDKANGSAVIEELSREFSVIAISPGSDSKFARAMACSPDVEAGNVWLPEGHEYDALVDALAKFPNIRHDDEVDALTQVLNWRRGRTHGLLQLWEREMARKQGPQPSVQAVDAVAAARTRRLEQSRAMFGRLRR